VSVIRPPLIAANWKMYKSPVDAVGFIEEYRAIDAGHGEGVETYRDRRSAA
jgi:triosephosphate isomerase